MKLLSTFSCSGIVSVAVVVVVAAVTTSISSSNVVLAGESSTTSSSSSTTSLSFDEEEAEESQQQQQQYHTNTDADADHHRYLLPASLLDQNIAECVLYLKDVQWEDGHADESWCCQFSTTTTSSSNGNNDNISSSMTQQSFGASGMMNNNIINIEGIPKEIIDSYRPISGGSILKVNIGNDSSSQSAQSASSQSAQSSSSSQSSSSYIQQSLNTNNDGSNPLLGEMKLIITNASKNPVESAKFLLLSFVSSSLSSS